MPPTLSLTCRLSLVFIRKSVTSRYFLLLCRLHNCISSQFFSSKYHAYLELAALARDPSSASRRTDIFTDTKINPTLWNALTGELLSTLDQDYQTLIRRGKSPAQPVVAPIPPVHRTPKTPAPTPLLRQPVLKNSPSSKFDALASDGSVTQTINSVSVPNVFLPSPKSTPKSQVAKAAEKATEVTKKAVPVAQAYMSKKVMFLEICNWMERRLPREWKMREWWTNVSAERQAKASLPEAALDIVAIDGTLFRIVGGDCS